jgi:uncharacterized protein Yka (UPF0111/DUF47 family)
MDVSNTIKKGRLGDISNIYNNIDTPETEADNMRRILSEELCKGTYFTHIREDLLNLVEEIDNIADYTKGSVNN